MRRFVTGICLGLLFLTVTAAQAAWWVGHTLLDTPAFADGVARAAADPQAQQELADSIITELQLGNLPPPQQADLEGAVRESVQDPVFAVELTRLAAAVHAALMAGRDPAEAADIGAVADMVRVRVAGVDPRLAAQIPEDPRRYAPRLGAVLPELAPVADGIRGIVPWLVAGAVVALCLGLAVSVDRPRTLRTAGITLAISVAVTVVLVLLAPQLLAASVPAGSARQLGRVLVRVLLGTMVGPLVAVGVAALVLLGAGMIARTYRRPRRTSEPMLPVAVSSTPLPPGQPSPVPARPGPPGQPPAETTQGEDHGGWGRLRY